MVQVSDYKSKNVIMTAKELAILDGNQWEPYIFLRQVYPKRTGGRVSVLPVAANQRVVFIL